MLTLTYITLAVLGCGYLAVSLLLGHLADLGGEAHGGDGGHGDAHAGDGAHAGEHGADSHAGHVEYGVGATGHGVAKASDGAAAAFHFPFFSPLAISTLFACIGGYGLIAKYGLNVTDGTSLTLSIPISLVTAYGITYAGWRIVSGSRGSSEIRLSDLAGSPAEVITPIPAGGLGEVAALVGGQRFAAPAREAEGREVPRGAQVTVLRMVGTTLLVKAP